MAILNRADAIYLNSNTVDRVYAGGKLVWPEWSPAFLFDSGENGAWYDANDLSTLFQDIEGTIPVTGIGQTVALMLDKSGNGNHVERSAAAARPTLKQDSSGRYYLELDGVDDSMATNSVMMLEADMTAVTRMSFIEATAYTGTSDRFVIGSGTNFFGIRARVQSGARIVVSGLRVASAGVGNFSTSNSTTSFNFDEPFVVYGDVTTSLLRCIKDGLPDRTITVTGFEGKSHGPHPIRIVSNYSGRQTFYSGAMINRLLTPDEQIKVKAAI